MLRLNSHSNIIAIDCLHASGLSRLYLFDISATFTSLDTGLLLAIPELTNSSH